MIQNQVYVFLWSILTGAILAFIFDLFRVARKNGKPNLLIVCIQDVLYFIIVAFIVVMSSFITNDGELRGYMFLGYALGVIFYLLLFSRIIVGIFSRIFEGLHKIQNKCFDGIKKGLKMINFKKVQLKKKKI